MFKNKLSIIAFCVMLFCLGMIFYSASQGKAFDLNGGLGFSVQMLIAMVLWIYQGAV